MSDNSREVAMARTLKKIQKFMGSLTLAIPLLFIIGVLSIMGGIVPQGTVAQTQANPDIKEFLKPLIFALQLHDVYRSPLFLLPLFVFFINLSFCTADQVLPRLMAAISPKRATTGVKALRNMKTKMAYPTGVADEHMCEALRQFGYKVTYQDQERYFFEKFKFSRFAAIVTHIGLFSIIIGVVVGSLTGFKTQITLESGQKQEINAMIAASETRGKYPPSFSKWQVSLGHFQIEKHANGDIAQYYSMLRIFDEKGVQRHEQMIWVNEPLIYEGVYFYQASWGISGITVNLDGKLQTLPVRHIQQMDVNVTRQIDASNGQKYAFLIDKQNNVMMVKDFQPIAVLQENQPQLVEGVPVTYKKLVMFTGLQVKLDQGIPLVIMSFSIIILGVLLALFSHREIWLVTIDGQRYLVGRTNKMKLAFFEDIKQIFQSFDITPDEPPAEKSEHPTKEKVI